MASAGATVLIAESGSDSRAHALRSALQNEGFRVAFVANRHELPDAIRSRDPAALIFELRSAGSDVLSTCARWRAPGRALIAVVPPQSSEHDCLAALDAGLDDFIRDCSCAREVAMRVRNILRRYRKQHPDAVHALEFDTPALRVRCRNHWIQLTETEFRILRLLALAPGRVYSREQLMAEAYRSHRIVTDGTITSHMRNLRRKLNRALPGCDLVRSVYGIGYKVELPLQTPAT